MPKNFLSSTVIENSPRTCFALTFKNISESTIVEHSTLRNFARETETGLVKSNLQKEV